MVTPTNLIEATASVRVENIGGISEASVDILPGVNVLTGRNATNRTSFLQALMAAMGSTDVSLKGDADEGSVELDLDDATYRRTLRRDGDALRFGGDPYLEDPTIADLFAFLLESNEARRAVVRGDDLRDLIMRPVDTDEIQAEIDRLKRERDEVDEQLEDLSALKEELPDLEAQKQDLETDIEAKREQLAATEAEIADLDADVDETREEKAELESRLAELRERRSDLEDVRSDIELEEESIAALRSERAELKDELSALPDPSGMSHDQLDKDISQLRERKRRLESEASELQKVVQFNEEMLDDGETAVGEALEPSEAVTDQLLADDTVTCWTCGSEVDGERIEETLDVIRSTRRDHVEQVREIEADLDELRAEKQEQERAVERRATIEQTLTDIQTELDTRESRLETLRERRDEFSAAIETLETEVAELESEEFSAVLDRHKEANQLEFELGRLESDLDDVTDRLGTIEDRLAEEEALENRREEIQSELRSQRTRIERIEENAVAEFNQRMEDVLQMLAYENIERIWIERAQRTVREGRRTVDRTVFDLHVVRTTGSGATYEDTVDHLSESEREVTGLIFALAGYLVHDVHETVPLMLLDSLEAIDAERLADLVAYLSEYPEYLVVALLPEDAQALSEEYNYVTDIS